MAQQKIDYPTKTIDTTVEERKITTLVTSQENNQSSSILDKYSKLSNELEIATETCIRITQNQYFYNEINQLKNNKKIESKSKLVQLNPFLDATGLLRVGGRLQHSELPFNTKHPYILPSDCKLSELIVRDSHERTLHGGAQLMLGTIRQKYWVIHAQKMVKKCVHNCIRCYRLHPQVSQQLMGSLPSVRVKSTGPIKI